jgi:hypothetical protein
MNLTLNQLKLKIKTTRKPWHLRSRYIVEYHKRKVEENKVWAVRDSADLLKLSPRVVQESIQIIKLIEKYPSLKFMKSREKAINAARDPEFDYFRFELEVGL